MGLHLNFQSVHPSQILFSLPYAINKSYLWLQAHEFYNFSLMLVRVHLLTFLIVVFIVVVLCPISYSSHSLLGLYFLSSSSSSSRPLLKILVFDFTLNVANPFEFLHYYFYAPYNMVTFHASRCLELTIMVDDLGTICLWTLFVCYVCFSTMFFTYI